MGFPLGSATSSAMVFSGSAFLEADLLVGCAEEVVVDQPQPRLRDARAVGVEAGDVPDGREHHSLVHELLDAMEERLASPAIELDGLLADEALDVGVAPIDVEAPGGHERVETGGRVAVGRTGHVHERANLLLANLR